MKKYEQINQKEERGYGGEKNRICQNIQKNVRKKTKYRNELLSE